jgi:hypothetical protein
VASERELQTSAFSRTRRADTADDAATNHDAARRLVGSRGGLRSTLRCAAIAAGSAATLLSFVSPAAALSSRFLNEFGQNGKEQVLDYPRGIATSPAGTIWVTNWENSRVDKYSATGTYERYLGSKTSSVLG